MRRHVGKFTLQPAKEGIEWLVLHGGKVMGDVLLCRGTGQYSAKLSAEQSTLAFFATPEQAKRDIEERYNPLNRRNMRKLITLIGKNEPLFSMCEWGRGDPRSCGTPACLAGWAAVASGNGDCLREMQREQPVGWGGIGHTLLLNLCKYLNIPERVGSALIHPAWHVSWFYDAGIEGFEEGETGRRQPDAVEALAILDLIFEDYPMFEEDGETRGYWGAA